MLDVAQRDVFPCPELRLAGDGEAVTVTKGGNMDSLPAAIVLGSAVLGILVALGCYLIAHAIAGSAEELSARLEELHDYLRERDKGPSDFGKGIDLLFDYLLGWSKYLIMRGEKPSDFATSLYSLHGYLEKRMAQKIDHLLREPVEA